MTGRHSILRRKYTRSEIVSDLEAYFQEQKLPADTLISPASRLAERYNVSMATINRALDLLVERKVLYRIQGSGTFTVRSALAQKRLRFGIILQHSGMDKSDLYGKVAFGNLNTMLQQYCQKNEHDCAFYFYRTPISLEHMEMCRPEEFDALIVTAGHLNQENSAFLRKLNVPVIACLGDSTLRTGFHEVVFDFKPGFRKLLEHLLEMGHRSFLIAGNEPGRTEAIFQAADDFGIPRNFFSHKTSGKKYWAEYWHTVSTGYEIAEYYLEKRSGISAIISTSDYISKGIISRLGESGLKPGRDYAIASYDNFERQGIMIQEGTPILTSITHPLEKMAEMTVALAVSETLAPSGTRHIIEVPADELTIRISTHLKIKTTNPKGVR
jgi:DNA-binding LacI/PurR family transcriptional regulator